ncbi:MAG: hypothetical protein NTY64_03315 [Deltaproteobacteria bacterium]|nr:hypothetical protein [Deltaproteobacteria bacterium]
MRCIPRHCGVQLSTPHSSGFARLASGAFYFVIRFNDFLRDHQVLQKFKKVLLGTLGF